MKSEHQNTISEIRFRVTQIMFAMFYNLNWTICLCLRMLCSRCQFRMPDIRLRQFLSDIRHTPRIIRGRVIKHRHCDLSAMTLLVASNGFSSKDASKTIKIPYKLFILNILELCQKHIILLSVILNEKYILIDAN